jgi:hypothetical protein
MYTVKPQFNGASVNYQNKKVVLNDKLSESAKAEMISSGLSRYFVDNPTVEKTIPVVKLQVIKKGAKGDEIEEGFNSASVDSTNSDSAPAPKKSKAKKGAKGDA